MGSKNTIPPLRSGSTVVITGASSGIGKALVELLLPFDYTIVAIARRSKEIPTKGSSKVHPISCDLSNRKELAKLVKTCKSLLPNGLDVLVNNAGITAHGRFEELVPEVFDQTFAINFYAPVFLTQGLLPLLEKRNGVVVSVSTVSGLYGVPGRAAYSASKSALHAAMESLRIERRGEGIRSIIFCPPYTRTNLRTSGLTADGKSLQEEQKEGKIKTPEEVASQILQAIQNKNSKLVTFDVSGHFVKWFRTFAPDFLESILHKKLKKDFEK